jgi:magnesium and cobalt transporter
MSPKKHPHDQRNLFERIVDSLSPGPDNKPELFQLLQQACERNVIDADGLAMIEGVIQVSELKAEDIMVPKSRVDMVNSQDDLETVLKFVIEKTHSRFPVYDKHEDKVIGILLAKDLLAAYIQRNHDWQDYLRPAVFVPESKPLNVLLREFRIKRNHLALVVDEFSQISGLITIEDVIEQIVGDIEDEYDFDKDEEHITQMNSQEWRVNALTTLQNFNTYFKSDLSDEYAETIGGFVTHYLGRLAHKSEVVLINDLRFEILKADARQVHEMKVRHALPLDLD